MHTKLREELLQVATETPSLDMLNTLTYLDRVVREVLRLHSVVVFVQREAYADDVIPLTDHNGRTVTQLSEFWLVT